MTSKTRWSLSSLLLMSLLMSNVHSQYVLINNTNVVVNSQSSQVVEFSLSTPIMCNDPHVYCSVDILVTNNRPDEIYIDNCHLSFTRDQWYLPQYLTIKPVEQYLSGNSIQSSLTLGSVVSNSEYYSGIQLPNITVHSTTFPSGSCSGNGDPHYTTFDGYYFNLYPANKYVLVSSTKRDFEIQVQTIGYPSQHCGFAVRENGDVVVVSACSGSISIRRSCSTEQCFANSYPKILSTSGTFSTYSVTMASGSIVQLSYYTSYQGNMYVTLTGIDHNSVTGLCGNFNGNVNDDSNPLLTPSYDLFSWQPTLNPSSSISTAVNCPYNPPTTTYSLINYGNAEDITNILTSSINNNNGNDNNGDGNGNGTFNVNDNINISAITQYCNNGLYQLSTTCSTNVNINTSNYIQNCIDDASYGIPLDMSLATAEQTLQSDCLSKMNFNVAQRNNTILNTLCPRNCSGWGTCYNAICQCQSGYTGNDCSINTNLSPTIQSISSNTIDVLITGKLVAITGNGFWSNNWTCLFTPMISNNNDENVLSTSAIYLSGFSVMCPLPNVFINNTINVNNNNITYYINVINENENENNQNENGNDNGNVTLTLYNSKCTSLNLSNTLCMVNDQCYSSYQLNPANPCQQCYQNNWTPVINGNLCSPTAHVPKNIIINQPLIPNYIIYSFVFDEINWNPYVNGNLQFSIADGNENYVIESNNLISLNPQPHNSSILINATDVNGRITQFNINVSYIPPSVLYYGNENENEWIIPCPSINCYYGLYTDSSCANIDEGNGTITLTSNAVKNCTLFAYSIDSNNEINSFIINILSYIPTTTSTTIGTTSTTGTIGTSITGTTFNIPSTQLKTPIFTPTFLQSQSTTPSSIPISIPIVTSQTVVQSPVIIYCYQPFDSMIYINDVSGMNNGVLYTVNCTNPSLYSYSLLINEPLLSQSIDINERGEIILLKNLTENDSGIYIAHILISQVNENGNENENMSITIYFDIEIYKSVLPSSSASVTNMIVIITIGSVLFITFLIIFFVKKQSNKYVGKGTYKIPLVQIHHDKNGDGNEMEFANPLYMSFFNQTVNFNTVDSYLRDNNLSYTIFPDSHTPAWHNLAVKLSDGTIIYEKIYTNVDAENLLKYTIGSSDNQFNNMDEVLAHISVSNAFYDNFRLKSY